MGVLSIRSTREEGFSPDDVELATVFASQAAIALENSRLYQKTQRTFDELTRPRTSSPRRARWRRWACWPAVWRMTSTTC